MFVSSRENFLILPEFPTFGLLAHRALLFLVTSFIFSAHYCFAVLLQVSFVQYCMQYLLFQPYNPYTNPYLAAALASLKGHHHELLDRPSYHPAAVAVPVAAGHLKHAPGHHPVAAKTHLDYYSYDVSQIPECAYTNKHYYNLTFCLQDDYYPM